ncbi:MULTISPECIES: lmo0937 family membrane protein [Clostridium]|uniref:lmo0937 family membrane protein n=1 Tax=Clostridium TaxID=1485 RepID=UPI001C0BF633|nr:lmo0937 family membrane protein [Clostridium estertheticum]MBU3177299.1 lmo0937 family membrane protein [Clostridium estertheticum]MBU3213681.1 lmo0937 family membrane protein [Clostridium estertheticum]MBX4258250.1 lmo0937 family membrane protein [Clostridium estertheticum]WAG53574.1 lmo0937 family membrane protein [Clostridium estertheticum]WLC69778.1 lmo0937 family membrane protein [Clostridium estertheticum]
MTFLRWLGGFVVLFWLMGVLFSKGGSLINILLIVAAIVFIIDILSSKRKNL